MRDPVEGVDAAGFVVTGVGAERVPAPFGPVIDAATEAVGTTGASSSLYLYGSVATGMAKTPASDVDLLTFGMATEPAEALARRLSQEFADRCRSVDIAVAQPSDLVGSGDAVYGNRLFLRHYCVHLCGPPRHAGLPDFPADRHAARGLNGDIDIHAERWRSDLQGGCVRAAVGRRVARKTLLATAGLVSIHDHTWTTDRQCAAHWAAEVAGHVRAAQRQRPRRRGRGRGRADSGASHAGLHDRAVGAIRHGGRSVTRLDECR